MKALYNTLHFIFHHPITRLHKFKAFKRFLYWQLASRTFRYPIIYPYIESSKLVVERGMTGATGNIYVGLHEFNEMGFLLHLLRPEDTFGDVGANIGSYTILASGVIKCRTIAMEPIAKTFLHLKHNVGINDCEDQVTLCHCGVGAEPGKLHFTRNEDTINHVALEKQIELDLTEEVEVITLDDAFIQGAPQLLKIDVEGFEMSVLRGAKAILGQDVLQAIIIELNGLCHRYGVEEEEIHRLLVSHDFRPIFYDPFTRELNELKTFNQNGNTIYARNLAWVKNRVAKARKIRVLGQLI